MRVREEHGFKLWRRDLEPAHLDELFSAVHDVPFLSCFIAVCDVACFEPAVRVEGLGVCFGVLVVALCYCWAFDAEFAADAVGGDVLAVFVD